MAAPIQAAQMTHYPLGVSSFGFPLVGKTTGRVFFVDSTSNNKGDDLNHGTSPMTPFSTIAYAVAQANLGSNRGDIVYVCPGHTETITTLGGITMSVAGVKLVGLGDGRDRPKITLSSSVDASVLISAANCRIENIIIDETGVDGIGNAGSGAAGLRIQEADFTLVSSEIILATAANQAACAIALTTAAHRCRILHNSITGSTTAGPVQAIFVYGAGVLTLEGIEIGFNRIIGDFSSSAIEISTTDIVQNGYVHDNQIINANATSDCIYINTAAGSSGVVSKNNLLGPSPSGTYLPPTAGWANVSNFAQDIDTASTLPIEVPMIGSQVPVGVSLVDQILGEFSVKHANYLKVTADFSLTTWKTVGSHEILTLVGAYRLIIVPEVTVDLTSGGAATMQLGDEANTAALVGSTTATDLDAKELWLSTTPSKRYARSSVIDIVVSDVDLGYEIGTAAMTGGTIDFHVWYTQLSSSATIQAGLGGSL